MERILIVEDDESMSAMLMANLAAAGYATRLARNGVAGLLAYQRERADLCLLDVMLPERDGFELAAMIKGHDPDATFIFLTARNTILDKKKGFALGCDDYLVKPFELEELLMRVNAVLDRTQRTRTTAGKVIQFGNCTLAIKDRLLRTPEKEVALTEKEMRLMHLLAANLDRTISRSELLVKVWGKDDPYHSKSMDVYLTRIRKYLRGGSGLELTNVYGHGYKLQAEEGR